MGKPVSRLKLTNGGETLIDREDYERVNEFGWHRDANGYVYRKVYLGKENGKDKYRNLFIHRFILNEPPGKTIDHINHDKLDNRKNNLRICRHRENMRNMKKPRSNTSGYKGVYWNRNRKKWIAQICLFGKAKNLGGFFNRKQAATIYNYYAEKYFGEFALLNKV